MLSALKQKPEKSYGIGDPDNFQDYRPNGKYMSLKKFDEKVVRYGRYWESKE